MGNVIQFKRKKVRQAAATAVVGGKPTESYKEQQERLARERAENNARVCRNYRIRKPQS